MEFLDTWGEGLTGLRPGAICIDLPTLHNQLLGLPKTAGVAIPGSPILCADRLAAGFPARFRDLPGGPRQMWYRGRLPRSGEPAIAVVGARAATLQGCARATSLSAALAERGHAIVSGGALGIDAAAHRGALEAGGSTFAILGCGVDVVYPDRHAELFAQVTRAGGLLSEYPPGTRPRPGQFPVRNRLVAALGDALLVVEAGRVSGALVTARLARAQGRVVMATGGSAGTDALIRSGLAAEVSEVSEIAEVLSGGRSSTPVTPPPALTPLLALLCEVPGDAATVARALGLSSGAALALLGEAEMDGWVRRAEGGRYEVPRGR